MSHRRVSKTLREFRFRVCLLLTSLLLTGCSLTSMQTSRQLAAGESIASMSVEPGAMKLEGQLTYGLEHGDVAVHAGSHLLVYNNLGVTGRGYPTSWLIASVQANALFSLNWFEGLVLTPRVMTASSHRMPFYLGVQTNVIPGNYSLLGGLVGIEVASKDTSFQIELISNPLMVINGRVQRLDNRLYDWHTPLIGFHLTIGFHHTFHRRVDRSGRGPSAGPEQTPEPRGPAEDVRQREEPDKEAPEPIPEPMLPVFDEGGVPLN